MPHRVLPFALALALCANLLSAQGDGERELTLGKEAFARQDHVAALEHLARATGALDPERDREPLADAYLHLGFAYLTGLDRPEQALIAFVKSAERASNPASAWLWASAAAERLGRAEEAARYKARALPAPRPEAPPSVPVAVEPEKKEAKPDEASAKKQEEKADAFDYFFGKGRQKKAGEGEKEKPAEEPPSPR
jgi:tetratricopeptide (TPR) repeat protein